MNPFITRTIIYPAYRLVKKDRVSSFTQSFERSQWMGRDEVLELQWNKLLGVIEHAYRTVPFYTGLFDGLGIKPGDIKSPADLRAIPPLTKDIIRTDLQRLTSSAVPVEQLHKDSTGGSTGEPTWYYLDDNVKNARQAMVLRGNSWAGARMGDRLATLWGAAFDLNSHQKLAGKIKSSILNTLFLSSYDLSSQRLESYASTLERFKPKLLTSYPGPLVTLGEFLRHNTRYRVKPGAIITSSETLFDHQRSFIEETYGCRVFNRYGSREFGAIAHECDAHEGLHINADRLYVEFIKEDGTPAGPGETGEMLITDLDNFGMPFIRYRIDDMAVVSDGVCSCGRGLPMIDRIEGRVFDVIVTASGSRFPGTFWTLLARAIPGIAKFQIIQKEPSSVAFNIVAGPDFDRKGLEKLKRIVDEHTGGELQVIFDVVDSIPLTRSGKHRFIVSEIARQENGH